MRRVAVIGVGVTKFGKHDRTSAELFAEAAAEAITDAQIAPTAVQALYFGNVTGGETERQLHMAPLAATLLGLALLYLGIAASQGYVQANYGLYLALNAPSPYEWKLLAGILGAALLMGSVPAWRAYRQSLADGLSIRL